MWTAWIFSSSVFLALYDVSKKASVRDNAVLPVLLVSSSAGAFAYVLALAMAGEMPEAARPGRPSGKVKPPSRSSL